MTRFKGKINGIERSTEKLSNIVGMTGSTGKIAGITVFVLLDGGRHMHIFSTDISVSRAIFGETTESYLKLK